MEEGSAFERVKDAIVAKDMNYSEADCQILKETLFGTEQAG